MNNNFQSMRNPKGSSSLEPEIPRVTSVISKKPLGNDLCTISNKSFRQLKIGYESSFSQLSQSSKNLASGNPASLRNSLKSSFFTAPN